MTLNLPDRNFRACRRSSAALAIRRAHWPRRRGECCAASTMSFASPLDDELVSKKREHDRAVWERPIDLALERLVDAVEAFFLFWIGNHADQVAQEPSARPAWSGSGKPKIEHCAADMVADDGNLSRRHDRVAGDLLIGKLHADGGLLQDQDARPPLHEVERVFRVDRPVDELLESLEHGGRRMGRGSGWRRGCPPAAAAANCDGPNAPVCAGDRLSSYWLGRDTHGADGGGCGATGSVATRAGCLNPTC